MIELPRSAAANQAIRDRRVEEILAAALDVFARQGFAAAKMADVAGAAGLSHGLVYHYFPDKEALFAALVERALYGVRLVVDEALRLPGTPWERLARLCARLLAGVQEQPQFEHLIVQVRTSAAVPARACQLLAAQGEASFAAIVRLVAAGQQAGEVAAGDPVELTRVFLATVQGLGIDGGPPVKAETVLRLLRP